jgi:hypothetical protein
LREFDVDVAGLGRWMINGLASIQRDEQGNRAGARPVPRMLLAPANEVIE